MGLTLAERASANLVESYLALGQALPGAEVRETSAFAALVSDLPHPSGNFATRLRLDPWSAADLRTLAKERLAFQVIALPDDLPAHLEPILRSAGFEPTRRMISMVAEPLSPLGEKGRAEGLPKLDMVRAEGLDERSRVGRFVADAFYARESAGLRATMAEALVRTGAMTSYAHSLRDRPGASVTLTRNAGILGIYNLCVAPPVRGQGLGKALVAWCLAQAASEDLAACLQCAPSLEGWYARLGFARAGVITIWSLQDR